MQFTSGQKYVDRRTYDINQFNPVPSQNLHFQRQLLWSFIFNDLSREVVVHFVDIGSIVDYHCLNFLFIKTSNVKIIVQIL